MEKCISCSTKLLKYNDIGNYCPNCYSIFASIQPSEEELIEYYNNFNKNYQGGGRVRGAKKRQLRYAEKYLNIVSRFSTGKELIDIGSSTNPFPNIARQRGYKVTVVDYIKPKELHPEIAFINSSIENLTSVSQKFDIVTAFAIIEHTRNPLLTLQKLTELCNNNGIVVIYIPEIGRFSDKYSLGLSRWLYPPEHLNLLSRIALTKLMEQNKCILLYYERFELDFIRFMIRYGIGLLEGIMGFTIKLFLGQRLWSKFRQNRRSLYQGLSMLVYKKVNTKNKLFANDIL